MTRRNPRGRTPHPRKARNSRSTKRGCIQGTDAAISASAMVVRMEAIRVIRFFVGEVPINLERKVEVALAIQDVVVTGVERRIGNLQH